MESPQNNKSHNPQNNGKTNSQNPDDKPTIGLSILSFFIPLVGFILAAVNWKSKPISAKRYLIISGIAVAFCIFANIVNPDKQSASDKQSTSNSEGIFDYYDPDKAPLGNEEALAYHKKYCDKNNKYACNYAALKYSSMKDKENAILYFEKGCKLKNGISCENLGNKYLRKDNNKAAEYFKKACDYSDYNEGGGCYELAGLLLPNDEPTAFRYYEKACDKQNGDGCYAVGLRYAAGHGVTKNMIKAKDYFKKGCKYGCELSCAELR